MSNFMQANMLLWKKIASFVSNGDDNDAVRRKTTPLIMTPRMRCSAPARRVLPPFPRRNRQGSILRLLFPVPAA